MAIYHMSIKIGSRSKGQSAVAASAYRSGQKLTDRQTGVVSDYTQKGGIVYSEISLCENAPAKYANREVLWNAVHEVEKNKNAQLWREFEVALPQELSREEQIATVRDFVKQLTARGMCADLSLHDKGDGNPHAHIMATMRSITEDGKWAAKSRLVYDLDEHGERIFQKVNKQGRKQYKNHKEDYNDWNAAERVEEWRTAWAECCNSRLAEHDRIDHRSYARQGVNQIPTVHEGYAARQRVSDGLPSDRVQLNDEIRHRNTLLQRIATQLKSVEEEMKQLMSEQNQEKGSALNGRVAELLARRKRTVDSRIGELERGVTDGERTAGSEDSGVTTSHQRETDGITAAIIRQADLAIEGADTNREAVRRATADTDTTIRQSETTITSAAANRRERELAEQRLAIEESRRAREEERKAREVAERKRKTSHYHGR